MNDITDLYLPDLPKLPEGWTWYIRTDTVDARPKVIVYLRDEKLHAVGHGIIDVINDVGERCGVYDMAEDIAKRAR